MKKMILFFFVFLQLIAKSQRFAGSFDDAKSTDIRISKLDSSYKNSVGEGKIVFATRQDIFIASYQKMMQDLGNYLKKNNYSFGKSTRSFTRVYFKADGSIDYFLYNFEDGVTITDKTKSFDILLKEFVSTYNIDIAANEKFAHCSPTTFR